MINKTLLFLFFWLFIISCSKNEGTGNAIRQYTGLSIKKLDSQSMDSLIKNRNGEILFLNIWATWCRPCIEEFPDIIKLYQNFSEQNVRFVAVSVDDPEDLQTQVIPFIKENAVPFDIFIQNFDDPQNFINSLNRDWNGAIPATFIYDIHANQRAFMLGKQDYDKFKSELENILKSTTL